MTKAKLNSLATRLNIAFRNYIDDKPSDTKDKPSDTKFFSHSSFSYLCTSRNMYIDLSKGKNRRDKRFIEDNNDF